MKKVIGICGSTRRNATQKALEIALEAAREAGVETEMVSLRGLDIYPCIHCDRCIRENYHGCPTYREKDTMDELLLRSQAADGLLVASPVYEMGISPQLSAYFSRWRSSYLYITDNPDGYSDKVGAAIAAGGTRNGGQEMTIQCIHNFFHTHGLQVIGGGPAGYGGAAVWSQDNTDFDETVDPEGCRNARNLGRRLAESVLRQKGD